MLNTDAPKIVNNNAIQGNSDEFIIFVKFLYPEVFKEF